jgi:hypothetical protein
VLWLLLLGLLGLLLGLLLLHPVLLLVAGVLESAAHATAAAHGVVLLAGRYLRTLGGVDVLLTGDSSLAPRGLFGREVVAEPTFVSPVSSDWLSAALVLVVATSTAG